jgi:hypothetical protein
MYLERSRSQQPVYKCSLPSHSDSSLSDSHCSIFAFLLPLAWLLTADTYSFTTTTEASVQEEDNSNCHGTNLAFHWPFTEPLAPNGCAITIGPCMY